MPDAPPIAFRVTVNEGARGEVALGYLRSRQYDLGRARCVVVGHEEAKKKGAKGKAEGVTLDGHWDSSTSVAQTAVLATGVSPGQWEVRCQTLPEGEQEEGRYAFRILSLMSA